MVSSETLSLLGLTNNGGPVWARLELGPDHVARLAVENLLLQLAAALALLGRLG